jgi:cytochrome c553
MQRLDTIIDALEQADRMRRKQGYTEEYLQEALAAARELKALKPVAMVDHSHPFSDDSVYMIANYKRSFPSGTKLYALDEDTK